MEYCIKCNEKEKEPGEDMCSFCLIQKIGLPWMNNMTIRHTMTGEIAYVEIDGKEYLLISGSGGMLFPKEQALLAEERFKGTREITK